MITQIAMQEKSVPHRLVVPGRYQRRQSFLPGPMLELAESIRETRLINPPIVYREGDHYELLIGERRWRAVGALALSERMPLDQAVQLVCREAPQGLDIPLTIRICPETDPARLKAMALVDNLQRQDLTPLEEVADFADLRTLGNSVAAIARLTGKAWQYVKGCLDWLELEPEIRQLYEQGLLCKDHRVPAALLSVPGPALRLRLAKQFAARRSPIRAIVAVCRRAQSWTEPAAVSSERVVVGQVRVEVEPAPAQTPAPRFCPACALAIHELAEELCDPCRSGGLTPACLECEGLIELVNGLIRLSEAAYAA